MYKRHCKNRSNSVPPKLKTGEILMEVCQGTVIRVCSPTDSLSYFDIPYPKYAAQSNIEKDGSIEILFAEGYEKEGYKKWLYTIDVSNKALVAVKPLE